MEVFHSGYRTVGNEEYDGTRAELESSNQAHPHRRDANIEVHLNRALKSAARLMAEQAKDSGSSEIVRSSVTIRKKLMPPLKYTPYHSIDSRIFGCGFNRPVRQSSHSPAASLCEWSSWFQAAGRLRPA